MADNPYETGLDLFKSRIIGNPYVLQNGLSDMELARVHQELLYWKFYLGDQWNFKRPAGEPQNTINYSARFVDKGVAFLMGKGFTINVHKDVENITKAFLNEVWDDNDRFARAIEIAQSGGITGNAFVKVALEEYDPETEPMLAELYQNGRIRITVLPSYACFPRWNNHDKERMDYFKLIYPITVYDKGGEPKQSWYREEWSNTQYWFYLDDELIKTGKNDLGIIPFVRIRNLVIANQSLGKSDLADIIPLNKEFNEKTTDVSDIINYHASPVTIVYGAKSSNLEKGARKIWGGLPKDAKVENLELKSDLQASMNYIHLIKNAMFEIASMPSDALGGDNNNSISNTTGIALQIRNQPLLDTNNQKRINYAKGIQEINRLILRIADVYELDGFDYNAFRDVKSKIKWHSDIMFPDPLPKDELIQLQTIIQKLNNHLMTRIDALKELGEHDAVGKYEEIKQDFIEWQNLMFEEMGQMQTSSGNLGGVFRQKADALGYTGRGHSSGEEV